MSTTARAVLLPEWIEPARAFAALVGDGDGYWLDAGVRADRGWSLVGPGRIEGDPASVRSVELTPPDHTQRPAQMPGPFAGGWVGWLDYESGAAGAGAPHAAESSPASGGSAGSGGRWLRAESLLAFDHENLSVWAIAPSAQAESWADAARSAIRRHPGPDTPPPPNATTARSRHSPERYAELIEESREAIRVGDAYQLCLTTRFTVDDPPGDTFAAYLRLRELAPTHHGGFIRVGDTALLSATPEQFLDARGGVVRTRPIKGTRPRDPDPDRDAALAEELRRSEKERAENVMIVDLMRNDLSRVGVPGGIRVEALLEVESYRAVHQLVSTVAAELRPGTTVGDLLDATFPAGSMTGAPKLSAMTILHRLEQGPRGLFAGCFGYVGHDGALDLAMVIRSIVVHPGGAYVGAGGGITWGSRAADEVAEVGWKAAAPLAALGASLPPGW